MIQSTASLILIWVTSLIEGMELQLNDEKRLCFLQTKFYHPQSRECQDPLEQGPCDQTQWLMPSTQDKMVLECRQRQETQERVEFIMKSNGDVVVMKERGNANIFKVGNCKQTERLLPVNFAMNTKPCPKDHQCSSRVSASLKVLEDIVKTNQFFEIKLTQNFFKNMICSKKPQKQGLCLPRDKSNLVAIENLYDSIYLPELVCMKNPCPVGKEPYQDGEGYFRCKDFLSRFTNLNSSYCQKGKILKRGRCTPRWIG